jgi:hypothetical protein
MEASLLSWMAVHGYLCLALRHPDSTGPTRELIEEMLEQLGALLVDREMLTPAELQEFTEIERKG